MGLLPDLAPLAQPITAGLAEVRDLLREVRGLLVEIRDALTTGDARG